MALILICDDEATASESIADALKRRGHRTLVASYVTDGINLLTQSCLPNWPHRDPIEVAIIDLQFGDNLDDTSGLKVFEKAVQVPLLESIILTAHSSLETAKIAVRRGAFAYLDKGDHGGIGSNPFFETLGHTVEQALEMRERMRAIEDSLRELKTILGQFSQSPGLEQPAAVANMYLDAADKAYHAIRRARGKAQLPRRDGDAR